MPVDFPTEIVELKGNKDAQEDAAPPLLDGQSMPLNNSTDPAPNIGEPVPRPPENQENCYNECGCTYVEDGVLRRCQEQCGRQGGHSGRHRCGACSVGTSWTHYMTNSLKVWGTF